eukprot:552740-Lingulodinium_polyedra.AAC.1
MAEEVQKVSFIPDHVFKLAAECSQCGRFPCFCEDQGHPGGPDMCILLDEAIGACSWSVLVPFQGRCGQSNLT